MDPRLAPWATETFAAPRLDMINSWEGISRLRVYLCFATFHRQPIQKQKGSLRLVVQSSNLSPAYDQLVKAFPDGEVLTNGSAL
jgi:hypothetical protein